MNNLQDLHMILFNQLDALDNPDLGGEEQDTQGKKSETIVKVAGTIINNAELALRAQKQFDEY